MRTRGLVRSVAVVGVFGACLCGPAQAQTLTADAAVKTAMDHSGLVVGARAGVMSARGSSLSAYGGILPNVSAALSRAESRTVNETGSTVFLGVPEVINPNDSRSSRTSPVVSVSWGILQPSSWANLSAARSNSKSARFTLDATRNDVALSVRRQFYEVVKAIKLAEVSEGSLQLARDDERRVRAMFEVGSVSKSDLLKAQVRTAQSEVSLLQARQAITVNRIELARQMGVEEAGLGTVDTLLTTEGESRTLDEAALLAEAGSRRPDLVAAEASLASARASHGAARLGRLPYVTASGSVSFNPKSNFTNTDRTSGLEVTGDNRADRDLSAQVALRWDVFSLSTVDARIASSRAALINAQEERDALRRNLAGEVRQAILAYREANESRVAAQRGVESATENLKLTQEKYNVGSATILELIDAQVQLETAKSDLVRALAAIKVAEAQINRVRGQAQ
jgi:outer membrane protein TolC